MFRNCLFEKQAVFRERWPRDTVTSLSENCSWEFPGRDDVYLGQIFELEGLDGRGLSDK